MFSKVCVLSLLMLFATAAIWLHTSQGKKIRWNGIDPQASHPTYAVYLHGDDWSFWRYVPVLPAEPLTDAHYAGKRRRLFMGFFWQSQWPHLVVMRRDPLAYYCIGLESELRLPYWFLFTVTSILPGCCMVGRVRRAWITMRDRGVITLPI